jgi:hypothetical protein
LSANASLFVVLCSGRAEVRPASQPLAFLTRNYKLKILQARDTTGVDKT